MEENIEQPKVSKELICGQEFYVIPVVIPIGGMNTFHRKFKFDHRIKYLLVHNIFFSKNIMYNDILYKTNDLQLHDDNPENCRFVINGGKIYCIDIIQTDIDQILNNEIAVYDVEEAFNITIGLARYHNTKEKIAIMGEKILIFSIRDINAYSPIIGKVIFSLDYK